MVRLSTTVGISEGLHLDLDGFIQNGYLTCGTLAPRASWSAGALTSRRGRRGPLIIKVAAAGSGLE